MAKRRAEILKIEEVLLAKERTILSFMQIGLTFIGLGVIVINVFDTAQYQMIGNLLIIIGFIEVLESFRRLRHKKKEMEALKRKGAI